MLVCCGLSATHRCIVRCIGAQLPLFCSGHRCWLMVVSRRRLTACRVYAEYTSQYRLRVCGNSNRADNGQQSQNYQAARFPTSPVAVCCTILPCSCMPSMLLSANCGSTHCREMGHINQLPHLLQFKQPQPPAAASAAAGMIGSATQFVDPSLRAAAGAAAAAAANTAVGAAAAAAVAAAGAAAGGWPTQVAANYLCLLETARLLLAAPHAASEEQRAQVGT